MDEMFSNNLILFMHNLIEKMLVKKIADSIKERTHKVVYVFKEIMSERNHGLLYDKLVALLPTLFNCQKAGVFFVDA
jgi:Ran GTPase-activating protein (RanGAP) involved in mRNA processing and transport